MPAIDAFVHHDLYFFHKNNFRQFCKMARPPVTKLWKTASVDKSSIHECMLVFQEMRMSPGKQRSSYLLLVFALGRLLSAADLSLPVDVTGQGSSVSISLSIAAGDLTGDLSGLQFDLLYDSSVMSVVVTPGDAPRAADKSVYFNDLSPGQRRFLCVGLNQNLMSPGILLNFLINLSSTVPAGTYPLVLTNLLGTDARGDTVSLTGSSGALTVQGSSGAPIQASGVLNAASLAAGPVAPGEIVSLVGSGIGPAIAVQSALVPPSTVLSGSSILFDGTPAPLLYAGPNQVNAVVPYEISGKSVTQLFIMNGGQLIAGLPLNVAPAAPAIFTLDSSGAGPGAILNQDSTVNSPSNPASRGSIIALFATGAGMMNPIPTDGAITGNNPPLASLPVSVQIGGLSAQVIYAGAAPGLIAGVLQVNCTIPQDIAAGEAVPVNLFVGASSSPAGVTIAVR